MNFKTAKTSEKLNFLAQVIEADPDNFNQGDPSNCVTGIGKRLQGDGTLRGRYFLMM